MIGFNVIEIATQGQWLLLRTDYYQEQRPVAQPGSLFSPPGTPGLTCWSAPPPLPHHPIPLQHTACLGTRRGWSPVVTALAFISGSFRTLGMEGCYSLLSKPPLQMEKGRPPSQQASPRWRDPGERETRSLPPGRHPSTWGLGQGTPLGLDRAVR